MLTDQEIAWAKLYRERRCAGESGWTTAESYLHKESRIEVALCGRPVPPPARFLELGCGAGNTTLWMAQRGYQSYGIDRVPEAIDWAQSRMADIGVTADLRVGNIADMSCFSDGFFNIVFDGDCLHMITDQGRSKSLEEIQRVLRCGGLFITGANTRDEMARERINFGGGSAVFDPEASCIWIEGRREYLVLTEQELVQEVAEAGFRIVGLDRRTKIGNQPFIKNWVGVHAAKE